MTRPLSAIRPCTGRFIHFPQCFRKWRKGSRFLGITAFHKVDSDPFGTIKYHYLPHIQSFFPGLPQDFMKTEDFLGWWKSMPEIHNMKKRSVRTNRSFTKEMEDRGYKWAVYCDPSPLEGFTHDPLRDFPRYLIETEKVSGYEEAFFYHEYGEAVEAEAKRRKRLLILSRNICPTIRI